MKNFTAGLAVVAVVVPFILGSVAFGDYVLALERGAPLPDFGVPLGQQKTFFVTADRLAQGGTVEFASHGALSPTLGYLSDDRWQIFDDRQGLRLPNADRASILAIDDPTSAAGQLAGRWLESEQVASLTLTLRTTVSLYRVGPGGAETAPGYRALDARFANGLTLGGFRVASDPVARKVRVDLHWRFDGLPPTKSPTVFNHLVGPGGETVSGTDGLAFQAPGWRDGEVFLDEFDLGWPTAPGPYRLQVGLYDYPSMRRFPLLRPAGGAPSDWIDLGPVSLTAARVSP
ncbi:MAG: hypothetical protein ACRDIY_05140 [Chloroflexota bacterium]